MKNKVNWRFGMAPLKEITNDKNSLAIIAVKDFVEGKNNQISDDFPDKISWVKGMFNRIIKQDQWDWFTVNMYFDYPKYSDLVFI